MNVKKSALGEEGLEEEEIQEKDFEEREEEGAKEQNSETLNSVGADRRRPSSAPRMREGRDNQDGCEGRKWPPC